MALVRIPADKPQIQPFSFPKNVALGEKTSVTCVVANGAGNLEFTWTQDGRSVENTASKHVKAITENIAAITIDRVTANDVGNYTCTVSNDAGVDSYSAALSVQGKTPRRVIALLR